MVEDDMRYFITSGSLFGQDCSPRTSSTTFPPTLLATILVVALPLATAG